MPSNKNQRYPRACILYLSVLVRGKKNLTLV